MTRLFTNQTVEILYPNGDEGPTMIVGIVQGVFRDSDQVLVSHKTKAVKAMEVDQYDQLLNRMVGNNLVEPYNNYVYYISELEPGKTVEFHDERVVVLDASKGKDNHDQNSRG